MVAVVSSFICFIHIIYRRPLFGKTRLQYAVGPFLRLLQNAKVICRKS